MKKYTYLRKYKIEHVGTIRLSLCRYKQKKCTNVKLGFVMCLGRYNVCGNRCTIEILYQHTLAFEIHHIHKSD